MSVGLSYFISCTPLTVGGGEWSNPIAIVTACLAQIETGSGRWEVSHDSTAAGGGRGNLPMLEDAARGGLRREDECVSE